MMEEYNYKEAYFKLTDGLTELLSNYYERSKAKESECCKILDNLDTDSDYNYGLITVLFALIVKLFGTSSERFTKHNLSYDHQRGLAYLSDPFYFRGNIF